MPEKIKPPVTPIIICFQLFIFTFSLLFSHSGYLLIFLSSVHRSHSLFLFCSNSLVITQQALGFQREMYSITRGSKQVEIFFSYSTRWMNSCNHQSAITSEILSQFSVQLVSYRVLVHQELISPKCNVYKCI